MTVLLACGDDARLPGAQGESPWIWMNRMSDDAAAVLEVRSEDVVVLGGMSAKP